MEIKRGIDKAVAEVVTSLQSLSKTVKDHSEVAQVGHDLGQRRRNNRRADRRSDG